MTPKAKFRVGQVVCEFSGLGGDQFYRIEKKERDEDGWYYTMSDGFSSAEDYLRPLTARECGRGKRGGSKP